MDANVVMGKTQQIQELLLSIGFPQNLYGYEFIEYALEMMLQNPDLLHHITKALYPEIAEHYHSTVSKVECAIRHSINTTWLYGDIQVIDRIFGNSVRSDRGVPTNKQLLAGLYYYIIRN